MKTNNDLYHSFTLLSFHFVKIILVDFGDSRRYEPHRSGTKGKPMIEMDREFVLKRETINHAVTVCRCECART